MGYQNGLPRKAKKTINVKGVGTVLNGGKPTNSFQRAVPAANGNY